VNKEYFETHKLNGENTPSLVTALAFPRRAGQPIAYLMGLAPAPSAFAPPTVP